jgi:hypothetical protein
MRRALIGLRPRGSLGSVSRAPDYFRMRRWDPESFRGRPILWPKTTKAAMTQISGFSKAPPIIDVHSGVTLILSDLVSQ